MPLKNIKILLFSTILVIECYVLSETIIAQFQRGQYMKVAIVGAGKLGTRLTEMLLSGDHSVTLIDKDEETINRMGTVYDVMTVVGNGKEISVLKDIEIEKYDYLVATTDRDEKNIVIASFARKLGCKKVIARIRDPEYMYQRVFIRDTMNIDYITNPDLVIALEINKYLVEKYTLTNGIFSTGRVAMMEFVSNHFPLTIGCDFNDLRSVLGNINPVALSRNGKMIIPHGEFPILADDYIYAVGERKSVTKLNKKVHEKGQYTNLQKVLIAGGGKTGFYLSTMLSEFGATVKIIEKSKTRCQYLAAHLDDVLILNGDATDVDLLEDEGLDEMDAFVSCTGYDEENLLLALMAKQEDVEDVIAKISKESYEDITGRMGVDMVMNPVDLSAGYCLRFMQGSGNILASEMIQGQAELMELLVDEDMILNNKHISKLDLPNGVVIAAIDRKDKVILPDKDTVITNGDRLMILTLLSEVDDLEKLIRDKKLSLF